MLKFTVLGNTGRYLAPLSGGSAYLVEEGDTRILLDAGGGARDALARLSVDRLDAVVISHFHYDHVLDLVTLRHVMPPGTPVVIPRGEQHRLDALGQAYAFDGRFGESEPRVVEATAPLVVGDLRLEFAATQHSAPAFATRIGSLVYASDTAPCAALAALARRARVLLMHTLLPTVARDASHARIHATAETAAGLAAEAMAARLLLSHRYHESPDAAMREAASTHFDAVDLARDDAEYEV